VTYIPADQVNAAFANGAVLVDNGHYMVHASRRDTEGQAEVHVKDADIIYMLDGTTTFISGGEVVGGRTTAADEIRGTRTVEGTRTVDHFIVVTRASRRWKSGVTRTAANSGSTGRNTIHPDRSANTRSSARIMASRSPRPSAINAW